MDKITGLMNTQQEPLSPSTGISSPRARFELPHCSPSPSVMAYPVVISMIECAFAYVFDDQTSHPNVIRKSSLIGQTPLSSNSFQVSVLVSNLIGESCADVETVDDNSMGPSPDDYYVLLEFMRCQLKSKLSTQAVTRPVGRVFPSLNDLVTVIELRGSYDIISFQYLQWNMFDAYKLELLLRQNESIIGRGDETVHKRRKISGNASKMHDGNELCMLAVTCLKFHSSTCVPEFVKYRYDVCSFIVAMIGVGGSMCVDSTNELWMTSDRDSWLHAANDLFVEMPSWWNNRIDDNISGKVNLLQISLCHCISLYFIRIAVPSLSTNTVCNPDKFLKFYSYYEVYLFCNCCIKYHKHGCFNDNIYYSLNSKGDKYGFPCLSFAHDMLNWLQSTLLHHVTVIEELESSACT